MATKLSSVNIALYIICFIALFLRLYKIGSIPVGFTPGEASALYDAYSLLHTGKDQWGDIWSSILFSNEGYNSGLLAITSTFFVTSFGLVKESVRVTNALGGCVVVVLLFYCSRQILRLAKVNKIQSANTALIASFFLAIAPWHVMLSRLGQDLNLWLTMFLLSLILMVKAITRPWFLIYGSLLMLVGNLLNMWGMPFTLLVVGLTLWLGKAEFLGFYKKYKVISVGVFIVFLTIIFLRVSIPSTHEVFQMPKEASRESYLLATTNLDILLAELQDAQLVHVLTNFVSKYLDYLSLGFIFNSTTELIRFGVEPFTRLVYILELPLLLVGMGYAFSNAWQKNKYMLLVFVLFFVLPIQSALTGDGGKSIFAQFLLIHFFSAIGIGVLGTTLKSRLVNSWFNILKYSWSIVFIFIAVITLYNYFVFSPLTMAQGTNYGTHEVLVWVAQREGVKSDIIVSKKLNTPHTYVALAKSWDPIDYQKYSQTWTLANFSDDSTYKLGKYTFKNINWPEDSKINALLVGRPEEFPSEVDPLMVATYPSGEEAIYVVDTRPLIYAQIN